MHACIQPFRKSLLRVACQNEESIKFVFFEKNLFFSFDICLYCSHLTTGAENFFRKFDGHIITSSTIITPTTRSGGGTKCFLPFIKNVMKMMMNGSVTFLLSKVVSS